MDKPSEQRKQAKECGDTDIGIQDYHAGGLREQLPGLWDITSERVVGLPPSRIATNCYGKAIPGERKGPTGILGALIETHDTRGPPLLDTSKPRRVF